MSHVWIVESKHWYGKEWIPRLGFKGKDGNIIRGIYRVRETARAMAKLMQAENQYNQLQKEGFISIRYRAAKYVREG